MRYLLILLFFISSLYSKTLYYKAIEYYAQGQNKKAAIYFEDSCNKGNNKACHALANLYLKGNGVVKNKQKAIDLLDDSCESLYTSSCLYLAFLYKEGTNIKKDNSKSQYYFKIACKRGNKIACKAIKQ